jgi:hypothetical protein
MIYEGDNYSGYMRVEKQAKPYHLNNVILGSNHHQIYGVDPDIGEDYNFGKKNSFSSLWRYEVGSHLLEIWDRLSDGNKKKIGIEEGKLLLQSVSNGRLILFYFFFIFFYFFLKKN